MLYEYVLKIFSFVASRIRKSHPQIITLKSKFKYVIDFKSFKRIREI